MNPHPTNGHFASALRSLRHCLVAIALVPLCLQGATFTWDNGGSGVNWGTGGNWAGNVAPTSGSHLLNFATSGTTANNNLGSFTLAEINFASGLGAGSFSLTGSQIVFTGTHDIDINHSGTATIFNNITSTNNLQIRGNNNGTLILSGNITGSGGRVTKFDNNLLVLSGSNAFDARIRIRGGVVESTSANGLGGAPSIDFEDDSGGSGAQTPTLKISTVDQTYTGTLRAEASDIGRIDVDTGRTFTVNGAGNALQWDNTSSGFIKQGGGTLLLAKGSTGDGTMVIQNGTVRITNATALGGTTNGTTVQSGGTLELGGGITLNNETLTLAGSGYGGAGALANQSGSNTVNSNITQTAATTISNNAASTTFTLDSSKTLTNGGFTTTFGGVGNIAANSAITGTGGVTKTGTGTTTLSSGSNTYTGATTVSAGTLNITNGSALGGTGSGTTVQSGGTLGMSGGITVNNETLSLAGTGNSGAGALASTSGNNTWNGNITLGSNATITNSAGGTMLTVGSFGGGTTVNLGSNTMTLDGAGNMTFNSQFSGTGGLVKNGTGTATLSYGNNSASIYTGATTVNAGTLIADLDTPITGTINVGDGSGTDTFRAIWVNQIGDNTAVNVNSSGVFEINSTTYNQTLAETLGSLNLQGGALVQTVDSGGNQASIVLNGNVTRTITGNSTANINGRLNLGGATRTFDVADSGAANDLNVAATVSNGSLVKAGTGTMTLSGTGANTITSTTVNAGTLTLNKTPGTNAISGNVTINGGTLLLAAANQIANSTTMTLAGGTFGTGGNSESLSNLTLSSASVIDLGAGGTLSFGNSSSESWSGSLVITSWAGDVDGGGSNQLFFGNNASGLTGTQIDMIRFSNPIGFQAGNYRAQLLASGELVPIIPEPGTIIGGALLTLGAAGSLIRRRKNKVMTVAVA